MSKYDIKNPKGLQFNNQSFNEYFIVSKSKENWIKWAKEQYKDTPFVGRRNATQQEELFTAIYQQAQEMTGTVPKVEVKPETEKIESPKETKEKK